MQERSERALKREILAWYIAAHQRVARELPWRKTRDPYAIWVSETMLQQTRAATVAPYWERFLRELPTIQSLAEAPEERVLALWSGLGYYRRARMLHEAAQRVVRLHGGNLPADPAVLRSLEGVGAYTAGAMASIAFKRRAAAVDGNVSRVLARVFAIEEDTSAGQGAARIWAYAELLAEIDEGDPGDWTQALMELGALVCTPGEPKCRECPVRGRCEAFARNIAGHLPRKRPKRAPTEVRSVAIVLATDHEVLLARRHSRARKGAPLPGALFAGLWEPPQVSLNGGTSSDAARKLAELLRIDPDGLEAAGEVVHVLTHRRMHVEVLVGALGRRARFALPGSDYAAIERVPLSELRTHTRPHATLTLKVLDMAKVTQGSLR